MALVSALAYARAQGPDDQYVRIYNGIQEAELLNKNDQPAQALTKYLEAQTALQKLQRGYPDWNPRVVAFRLNYVADKISAISGKARAAVAESQRAQNSSPPAPPATNAATPPLVVEFRRPPPTVVSNYENQIATLHSQVRQLQTENSVLEAKLKEALSVQPAALDPRELNKALEQINSLKKENELLKVTVAQQKTKAPAIDNAELEQTRKALADATRQLEDQTKKATALELEKRMLQTKLAGTVPGTPGPSNETNYAADRKNVV